MTTCYPGVVIGEGVTRASLLALLAASAFVFPLLQSVLEGWGWSVDSWLVSGLGIATPLLLWLLLCRWAAQSEATSETTLWGGLVEAKEDSGAGL